MHHFATTSLSGIAAKSETPKREIFQFIRDLRRASCINMFFHTPRTAIFRREPMFWPGLYLTETGVLAAALQRQSGSTGPETGCGDTAASSKVGGSIR